MPRLPGVPDSIALLEGPIFLGQCFAWGLHGILVVQLYIYATTFPNDRWWIKTLAYSVFMGDVLTTVFGAHFAFVNLASGWGDTDVFTVVPWSMPPGPVLCGFITSAVQLFYCWRIWILSKNKYLPGALALLSVTQCGAAAYCGINLGILGDWTKLDENNDPAIVWLGGSALCDAGITISMVTLLFRANRNVGFRRTNTLINKLIQYTIETGMIPALGALGELVFFLAMPTNNLHLIFFFTLAKLYSNSMMANLNARTVLSGPNSAASGSNAMNSLWIDPPTQRSGVKITTTTLDDRVSRDTALKSSAADDLEMGTTKRSQMYMQ